MNVSPWLLKRSGRRSAHPKRSTTCSSPPSRTNDRSTSPVTRKCGANHARNRPQLAALHFGPQSDYSFVPEPLETRYMVWSLPPFNAGYHAYAAHFNICDVQQKIRKPSQLIDGADANIFIVGETYSNDQAWVEGAFCTAESVLNDFFGIEPIIDNKEYPFICSVC